MTDTKLQNHGLLPEKRLDPRDNLFGVATVLEPKILQTNMIWTPYLGKYEPQSNTAFDSMGCVSFSNNNCTEMRINRMIRENEMDARTFEDLKAVGYIDELDQFNASDRFTAKISGTTIRGNYMSSVANSVMDYGLLPESLLPFDLESVKTFEDFYATIPIELVAKAKKFLEVFDYGWEWVGTSTDILFRALQTSPLQVTVQVGSPVNDKGFYINRTGDYSHAVAIHAATDHFGVFDHYTNKFKKYDLSYKFGAVMRFFIQLKKPSMSSPNPLNLPNNCKVFVVTDKEIFKALFIGKDKNTAFNDKMVLDNPALVDDQWEARNEVDGWFRGGAVRTITKAQFDLYAKCNFKGQIIN